MGTLLGVLGELRRRLSFTRARHDQWASELDEEMAFHVEMRRQQNLERGMSSDEARRAAAIDFGNTMVLRERSREAWLVPGMEGFLQDVRVALRNLVKNPGWTGLAAGTLAIAIAVCASVFSLVHAVLVRPLPYASERELVLLFEDRTSEGFPQSDTSPGNYRQLKVDSKSYQGMSLFHRTDATLSADGTAERITGVNVTPDFFDVLGIKPSMGRFFGADNAGARVVVISHELWQRNLGGRADIIGHNLQLGEESWTVVGVAPRRFQFLFPDAQFWRPLQFSLEAWHRRELRYLNVVARLRSGTPIEQAQAELTALAPSFRAASPTANRNFRAVAVLLGQSLTGGVRHRVLLL
ncbi:MAG TPA: ABC transporter permease, partial [Bryobacteraceae bacterium]|nr:ABC transporter permease [Bryobacteraceae bacterium]